MTSANIYSQGFRPYEGVRTGHKGAAKALFKQSLRNVFGINRKFRNKVVPILALLLAYIPVIVFIAIVVLASNIFGDLISADDVRDALPSMTEFFGWIRTPIFLLAGFAGPLLLSDDRRDGMLGVYLSSPLTRTSYVLTKFLSTLTIVLTVCFIPPLILLVSLYVQGLEDGGIVGFFASLFETAAGALIIGGFYSVISLAISSVSDRKSVSWTSYFIALLISASVVESVADATEATWVRPFNFLDLPNELVRRLAGETGDWSVADNPTSILWLTWLGVIALCCGLIWNRYSKLLVRR